MSLTLVRLSGPYSIGDRWVNTFHVTFDSSYPTGGEPCLRTDLGFAATADPDFYVDIEATLGYVIRYDHANQKILVYETASVTPAGTVAAPVFTGSALAAHTHDAKLISGGAGDGAVSIETTGGPILRIETIGADQTVLGVDSATKGGVLSASAGTPAGTNSAPAFTGTATSKAALAEVGNTDNLSALVNVRLRAQGKFLQ